MKHLILSFITLLIFQTQTNAQNIIVEYKVYLNTLERTGFLHISKEETPFYYETPLLKQSDVEENKEENNGVHKLSFVVGLDQSAKWYQIYSVANDTLYDIENLDGKQMVYYDNVWPNWTFTEEEQELAGYKCMKAQTLFRGRNYTAWFTPEISTNVGPWKFRGLPGLILAIYDDEKSFSWFATKIHRKSEDAEHAPDIENTAKISFQEFVELQDLYRKEESNKVFLRALGKNAIITGGKTIRGRELKYEWEK